MTVPFAVRVFGLSFLPLAALLVGSFWSIQYFVAQRVKDGLRASLRQSHDFVSRVRASYELRNNRLLAVLAENPSLKAGFELVGLESGSGEAKRTLEGQLEELSQTLEFDFMAAANAREEFLAGVVRLGDQFTRVEPKSAPHLSEGAMSLGEYTYILSEVPVNLESESLGTLYLGRLFDLSDFSAPTVLSQNGKVLRSNLTGIPAGELETAFEDCAAFEECEVSLRGETYLCLPLQSIHLGDGYLLRSLQSVDAASEPLRGVVQQVFLAAGSLALVAISILSLFSSKGIVKPLTGLIAKLEESESSGVLPHFETSSSTREINHLLRAFNAAAVSIGEARERLTHAYREFTQSLSNAIDARDIYTAGHSRRVSAYAVAIAEEMKLSAEEIKVIREGALLHDVGKIGISDSVLQKPGNLTPQEFELIRRHPLIGKRIIERVEGLASYLSIVELHHENHDGSGYPWQLAGSEIPREARIVHVADAFDAMTSDRPYRKGMTPEQALGILQANAGTQFDPLVVEAFARLDRSQIKGVKRPVDAGEEPDLDRLSRALDFADGQEMVEEILS